MGPIRCPETSVKDYYATLHNNPEQSRSQGRDLFMIGKAIPLQAWFQEVEAPRFLDNRHIKVVRLSALRTGRLYPPGNSPGTHFW
jgi:hypothetical protein